MFDTRLPNSFQSSDPIFGQVSRNKSLLFEISFIM